MEHYIIDDKESVDDFLEYVKSIPTVLPKVENDIVEFNGDCFEIVPRYRYILRRFNGSGDKTNNGINIQTNVCDMDSSRDTGVSKILRSGIDNLIFGKDPTEHIVAMEVVDEEMWLFKADGSVEKRPNSYWLLASKPMGKDCQKLEGSLFYKYKKTFTDLETFKKARGILYGKKTPMFNVYDPIEAFMMMNGVTFFKGLKVNEVSVLSFDIESTGITHNSDSRVLLISNTYRDQEGKLTRKIFDIEDYGYDNDGKMIKDWCVWVRTVDPSIVIGHNIFGFDIPYLEFRSNGGLDLGKDGSMMKSSKKPKKFRKDGSQEYDFFEAKIFGRQIIDTWMLAIRFDFGRKYENYKLKNIIAEEGLEKKDRAKFNFDEILPKDIYKLYKDGDIDMWKNFKKYCIEDSDDALKLFDLMIPQYFYYMQSLPMPFQTMAITATGRQINGFLCRSYLQDGHSIPLASNKEEYGGGISHGFPGVYDHVYKVDVASLYPSIMITEEVYDEEKDPKAHFLTMVKHFTKERLENKQKAKETGDSYYKHIEQAQKIVINSAYGLLGTPGLNFNSMHNADKVTAKGREILQKGIEWVCGRNLVRVPVLLDNGAEKTNKEGKVEYKWDYGEKLSEGRGFKIVNVDTDSFSYTTGKKLVEIDEKQAKRNNTEVRDEFQEHIDEINKLFKDGISWEDDGYFKKLIVVKAKNYILFDGKKVKIKGQALKGTGKEKALTDFVNCVIMLLLKNRRDHIFTEYQNVALAIKNDWDVNEWNMKKTVTKAVLNPNRKQEQKVLDAIQNIDYQEGDKVYMYVKDKDTLKLVQDFDGEYCRDTYYGKLHDTLKIFGTLLDSTLFPNYKTGRNKELI